MDKRRSSFVHNPLPLVTDRQPRSNMPDTGDDNLGPMMDVDFKDSDTSKGLDGMGPQSSMGAQNIPTAPDAGARYDAPDGMNRQLLSTSAGYPAQMCDAEPMDATQDTNVRDFSSEDEINETLYGRDGSM
ncbi:uncharacterized protein BO72DRAFT_61765 [Aspergillus fijiensis CBS 313.89]|uniref:Uncharacterized protein n=1 Tax=Aspergillus fijiensis CBS 313.89 TaxID=1448319 RepID=A0A8G1RWR5_9EURO|nr:uncharacterized protein BO72DRAFT_61765 [Aspergillus fijiensis CBS 313.89]RAK78941.1 hypothetical protein BO72DRAFT_61765 [Aspergillus fijiensis CBS 313.89]